MTSFALDVSGRFIDGPYGPLALSVWRPRGDAACRFSALFVPSAFEELNKGRRMAALQARELAALGGLVVHVDPRGTGDSGGEHGDATWVGWQDDVQCAWNWLGAEASVPRVLHGLRLGGLLAAELASKGALSPALLVLWQPVLAGRLFFNQLLRLSTVRQMVGRAEDASSDAKALRSALASGASVEIAGYDVHPALLEGAERVELGRLPPPKCAIVWRETGSAEPATVSPAAANAANAWRRLGADVDVAAVSGPPFWMTQEIAEAPALVASTCRAIAERLPPGPGAAT